MRRPKPNGALPKDGDRETVRIGEERIVFTFDGAAAQRAVDFFPGHLRHFEGPRHVVGQPFKLAPWQFRLIWHIFGWKRKDGTRRYRSAFVGIPRKNGKSAFGAGLALLLLTADDEPGAQIYGAASDSDQAKVIWRIAAQFVLRDPDLRARLEVFESSKTIAFRDPLTYGPGFYRAIPADEKGALGFNAHGVIVDELLTQPNRKLVDALTTSVGARTQPLTVFFTTAGYDEDTICGEEWGRAVDLVKGTSVDPYHYAVIYAANEGDDVQSPEVWERANPGWDYMGDQFRQFIKDEARKAVTVPAFENPFKMYHLNIWTKQSIRWMPMDAWDRGNGFVSVEPLLKRDCWLGVSVWDSTRMAAAVIVFAPEGGDVEDVGTYDVLPFYWLPENVIDRDDKMRSTYMTWRADSFLHVHPGAALDVGQIRKDLNSLITRFRVRGFRGNRLALFEFGRDMEEAGIEVDKVQHTTADMSAATKTVMRLALQGRIRHGGHPILRWNADNLVVIADASGEIRPSRTKSPKSIEGFCALIMAMGPASQAVAPVGAPSIRWIA